MTVVEVSKAQILKSIREEPVLGDGRWIAYGGCDPNVNLKSFNRRKVDCQVCAVGSIFRRIIDPETKIRDMEKSIGNSFQDALVSCSEWCEENVIHEANEVLLNGYPMNALSIAFEGFWKLMTDRGEKQLINKVRKLTLEFVEDYFPSEVLIDIDGLKPAKDVKVVDE